MVEQTFISLTVKWRAIISNKLVCKSCLTGCWATEDLWFKEIRKYQENFLDSLPSDHSSSRNDLFLSTSKTLLKADIETALFHIKNMVCLKHFVNDCRFNCVSSIDKLRKIKNGISVIDLLKKSKRTNWFSLFINRNNAVCFDSFWNDYAPHEVLIKNQR